MKIFEAELRSLTPYSQGRHHNTPKVPRELDPDYEARTVLAKLHTSMNEIFIPPMCFKLCLESTAGYSGERVPGKGQETYTKHYRRGVICSEPVMLGIKPDDVRVVDLFLPSQPGKPKSPRVWKKFPVIDRWAGVLEIIAIDDLFTAEVVHRHLQLGGLITGIGVWRPENSGMQGKFEVTSFKETTR
jgi:hypothetical protein